MTVPALSAKLFTIGSVSFLNAKPLIYGLTNRTDLRLVLDVPAELIGGLRSRLFDVALLPVIDVLRTPGLRVLTSGGIGCDGPTLTVRLFSKVPINTISTLACDTHSHSSVALVQIILAESYGVRPRIVDLQFDDPTPHAVAAEARLLIGDKVVTDEPAGFEFQLDLGSAWKQLTGLPFVFAAWVCHADADPGDLPARLEESKILGLANVEQIIRDFAVPRGWPADLARQYMTQYLHYDIGPAQLEAIKTFHRLATKHGLGPGSK